MAMPCPSMRAWSVCMDGLRTARSSQTLGLPGQGFAGGRPNNDIPRWCPEGPAGADTKWSSTVSSSMMSWLPLISTQMKVKTASPEWTRRARRWLGVGRTLSGSWFTMTHWSRAWVSGFLRHVRLQKKPSPQRQRIRDSSVSLPQTVQLFF